MSTISTEARDEAAKLLCPRLELQPRENALPEANGKIDESDNLSARSIARHLVANHLN